MSSKVGAVYTLNEALAKKPRSTVVRQPLPNEAAREELLLQKLGARGWGRIHHFRDYYTPGWGEERCRPLSPRATETFFRFLEAIKIPTGCVPSVFLTDNGGLELRWEREGNDIQVEFTAAGIEYYAAREDVEEVVPHDRAVALAQQLSAH